MGTNLEWWLWPILIHSKHATCVFLRSNHSSRVRTAEDGRERGRGTLSAARCHLDDKKQRVQHLMNVSGYTIMEVSNFSRFATIFQIAFLQCRFCSEKHSAYSSYIGRSSSGFILSLSHIFLPVRTGVFDHTIFRSSCPH